MAFKKDKTNNKTGAVSNYHIITSVNINFGLNFNSNDELIKECGTGEIVLSSFVNKEHFIVSGTIPGSAISIKYYHIDYQKALDIIFSIDDNESSKEKAYNEIIRQDIFFDDAELVD